MRCNRGMPKPSVLPVPVLAWPMMSCPCSATGRVSDWIGNGWVMPTASRAATVAGSTPSSANVGAFTAVVRVVPLSPCSRGQGPHAKDRRAARGMTLENLVGADRCADRASVLCCHHTALVTLRPVTDHAVGDPMVDEGYRAAVIDLLAALAYGELTAFERLADDASFAPTISDKAALAAMAVAEYNHFALLTTRLRDLGASPEEAMEPFVAALEAFHERTAPGDWLEGLVKAYVGDGIAEDFYREVSAYLDPSTRDLVLEVLEDTGHSEFAVDRVRAAIDQDPKLAGRLALWGRRLVGEALSQAQRVAAERDALAALLVGGVDRPGADLAEVGRMFARLTENHTRRMAALGLSA